MTSEITSKLKAYTSFGDRPRPWPDLEGGQIGFQELGVGFAADHCQHVFRRKRQDAGGHQGPQQPPVHRQRAAAASRAQVPASKASRLPTCAAMSLNIWSTGGYRLADGHRVGDDGGRVGNYQGAGMAAVRARKTSQGLET